MDHRHCCTRVYYNKEQQGYSLTMQAQLLPGNKFNLLIGVTGSVATIKLKSLIESLLPYCDIRVIVTQHAKHFLNLEGNDISQYGHLIYSDEMEWQQWGKRGDAVLHIELRKWAQCLLIAPLSANTLAKLSNGLCDNLLTLVCRAWPMTTAPPEQPLSKQSPRIGSTLVTPIIICPSMNTIMWEHPVTGSQLAVLRGWGYESVGPVSKRMMCGDVGEGAMAEVTDIVQYVLKRMGAAVDKGQH